MKASTLVKSEKMILIFPGDEPVEDRTLNLTVNPGALTPAKEAKIRASDEDDSSPIAEMLADLVSEWDMEMDGKVIDLTHEALMHVPIIVLGMVLNEISKEFQERTSDEGKDSVAT